jgi:hypothetical protein
VIQKNRTSVRFSVFRHLAQEYIFLAKWRVWEKRFVQGG